MEPQSIQSLPRAVDAGHSAAHRYLESLLAEADIRLEGQRPWDMRLRRTGVAERILAQGSLGLGESYMDGWWDCDHLDQFFDRLLRADIPSRAGRWAVAWHHLRVRWFNLQTEDRMWEVGRAHYDPGSDFYASHAGSSVPTAASGSG